MRLSSFEVHIRVPDLGPDVEPAYWYFAEAFDNYLKEVVRQRFSGLKLLETSEDDVAYSNTIDSGVNFKWMRNSTPLWRLAVGDRVYVVWLDYVMGYNAAVNLDAPWVIKFDGLRLAEVVDD